MSIIDEMAAALLCYEKKSGLKAEYCYMSYEEGFELLEALMPTMELTYMQVVELNMVLKEHNVPGLRQAFINGTFNGAKIKLMEEV